MQPRPFPIDSQDLENARRWEDSLVALQLADDEAFVTGVATRGLARALGSLLTPGRRVSVDMEVGRWPALLVVSTVADPREQQPHEWRSLHGFVVAAQSSLEPRPVWPADFRAEIVRAGIDFAIAAYLPKRLALESHADSPTLQGQAVGWLDRAGLMALPQVDAAPHPGHPFAATYHQGRLSALRDVAGLPAALMAGALDRESDTQEPQEPA